MTLDTIPLNDSFEAHDNRNGAPRRADATSASPHAGPASVHLWTLGGTLFGLAFPIIGLLVASSGRFDVVAAHQRQSVLYIVDLAPFVLGIVGHFLGRLYGGLVRTRLAIEQTVADRTCELEAALIDLGDAHTRLLQGQRLEAIGGLAAGVAHEINTPIQYIGDNVRFLQDSFAGLLTFQHAAFSLRDDVGSCPFNVTALERFDDEVTSVDLDFLNGEVPTSAEEALEGIQRVTQIVRALKDFAHPGSESKAPIDINAAILSTIAVSRSEWKYVAEIETDLDADLPTVNALAGPIKQVLLILIVNAAQALEEQRAGSSATKGSITITSRSLDQAVVIEIADDAGGIPVAVQSRIFDPFFTTKDVGKGSGQGLALARAAVVDQHQGDLTFDVRAGVGTTFTVLLPIDSHVP